MRHPSIALFIVLLPTCTAAQTLPPVTITRILPDTNSIKLEFTPVPGALGYRIYSASNPTDVKYAGLVHVSAPWGHDFSLDSASPKNAPNGAEIVRLPLHLQDGDFAGPGSDSNHPEVASIAPYIGAIPATQIEWNGLTHGVPATLILEAVDAPGPTAPANLTNYLNRHAVGVLAAQPHICTAAAPPFSTTAHFFGADKGATPDGNLSTNGQANYCSGQAITAHMLGTKPPTGIVCADTAPRAIARSAPFTATADAAPHLPSGPDANPAQLVYDRFDSGIFTHRRVTTPSRAAKASR